MRIAVACDHRGYTVKEKITAQLIAIGHEVQDFGCASSCSCDYPDHGFKAAEHIAAGGADAGILICGTGIGMSITANKVRGIRASLCHDELTAELARRHADANVLCLPADLLGEALIKRVVEAWINTPFDGGRHARRIEKIRHYETNGQCAGPQDPH
jgi:ribose 5-phosphate isomerase B